jgi:signal peptidase II
MTISKHFSLVLMILVTCVGCDQVTKSMAKAHLSETEAVSLLGGGLRLQVAKNYGAFLSLGASMPAGWRSGVFSAGVGLLLASLLAYVLITKPANPMVAPAIALVVGGGLSNLIDRLQYGGYVLDFINVGVGEVRTGIFNAADMAIVLGILLLMFGGRLCRRMQRRPEARRQKAS